VPGLRQTSSSTIFSDGWAMPAFAETSRTGQAKKKRIFPRWEHIAATRSITEPEILFRFSSLHLLRITSWSSHYRRERSVVSKRAELSLRSDDFDKTFFRWFRVMQALHYLDETTAAKNNHTSLRQRLKALNPFADDYGIITIGGRLKHAALSMESSSWH